MPKPLPLPADPSQRKALLLERFGPVLAESELDLEPNPAPLPEASREAALARLQAVDSVAYGESRNHLAGAVTRLSPYLRHGLLSLAEVRDHVLAVAGQRGGKLIQELAWRDYFQRLLDRLGFGVLEAQEDLKTGLQPEDYADALPEDLRLGRTGLVCVDGFVATLRQEGWLHNHARMWLAAAVVHHFRIRWQAGADWMAAHLIDGDLGSNHLSWQWVASSFSAKPYRVSQPVLAACTDGAYCRACPHYTAGTCPFTGAQE